MGGGEVNGGEKQGKSENKKRNQRLIRRKESTQNYEREGGKKSLREEHKEKWMNDGLRWHPLASML